MYQTTSHEDMKVSTGMAAVLPILLTVFFSPGYTPSAMPLKATSMAQVLCPVPEHSPATRPNRRFRIVPPLRITRLDWASDYRHLHERQ
jgi:hypothetical protein